MRTGQPAYYYFQQAPQVQPTLKINSELVLNNNQASIHPRSSSPRPQITFQSIDQQQTKQPIISHQFNFSQTRTNINHMQNTGYHNLTNISPRDHHHIKPESVGGSDSSSLVPSNNSRISYLNVGGQTAPGKFYSQRHSQTGQSQYIQVDANVKKVALDQIKPIYDMSKMSLNPYNQNLNMKTINKPLSPSRLQPTPPINITFVQPSHPTPSTFTQPHTANQVKQPFNKTQLTDKQNYVQQEPKGQNMYVSDVRVVYQRGSYSPNEKFLNPASLKIIQTDRSSNKRPPVINRYQIEKSHRNLAESSPKVSIEDLKRKKQDKILKNQNETNKLSPAQSFLMDQQDQLNIESGDKIKINQIYEKVGGRQSSNIVVLGRSDNISCTNLSSSKETGSNVFHIDSPVPSKLEMRPMKLSVYELNIIEPNGFGRNARQIYEKNKIDQNMIETIKPAVQLRIKSSSSTTQVQILNTYSNNKQTKNIRQDQDFSPVMYGNVKLDHQILSIPGNNQNSNISLKNKSIHPPIIDEAMSNLRHNEGLKQHTQAQEQKNKGVNIVVRQHSLNSQWSQQFNNNSHPSTQTNIRENRRTGNYGIFADSISLGSIQSGAQNSENYPSSQMELLNYKINEINKTSMRGTTNIIQHKEDHGNMENDGNKELNGTIEYYRSNVIQNIWKGNPRLVRGNISTIRQQSEQNDTEIENQNIQSMMGSSNKANGGLNGENELNWSKMRYGQPIKLVKTASANESKTSYMVSDAALTSSEILEKKQHISLNYNTTQSKQNQFKNNPFSQINQEFNKNSKNAMGYNQLQTSSKGTGQKEEITKIYFQNQEVINHKQEDDEYNETRAMSNKMISQESTKKNRHYAQENITKDRIWSQKNIMNHHANQTSYHNRSIHTNQVNNEEEIEVYKTDLTALIEQIYNQELEAGLKRIRQVFGKTLNGY